MELYCPFVLPEPSPGEERKAQIDSGGVEGIYRFVQLHSEVVAGVKRPSNMDQYLSEVGIDAPVAIFVGFGDGTPSDVSTDSHVVETGFHRAKACFDIS